MCSRQQLITHAGGGGRPGGSSCAAPDCDCPKFVEGTDAGVPLGKDNLTPTEVAQLIGLSGSRPPRTLSRNLQLRDIQTLSCSTWSATPSPDPPGRPGEGENMSVYRVTEVIGTSTESWEHAARSAVETAAATVREIRVAEVTRQDVTIENGQVSGYRVRLAISFKYESDR